MNEILEFEKAFKALTDYTPMKWQLRLFEKYMMRGDIPHGIDLPTGIGKTSVIPIWLIALASQAVDNTTTLPRRLIYIVNRRTVVDQATNIVEQMRNRLLQPSNPAWQVHGETLVQVATALRFLSSGLENIPLAVSTLRGELADNDEWKTDPARPAIIVGTIDMIGSKLLFSGYGDGKYHRPHHAGLIGQDSLIVHDEAHLTPAFNDLLQAIARAQLHDAEKRSVKIMELSATRRGVTGHVFTLEPEDETDQIVRDRLDAQKSLRFHESDEEKPTAKLAELAARHEASPCKVLIYARDPETVLKVKTELYKKLGRTAEPRIALLTGTMRGYERDQLVKKNEVYLALLNADQIVKETVYLISTSAGEVGIDLDADNLICDLTTLDSIIQRFGRVNRKGGKGRVAELDIVFGTNTKTSTESTSDFENAVRATKELLMELLPRDASPRALREMLNKVELSQKEAAFSPKPAIPAVTDIHLDNWSLTTISEDMPGRPEVASYLHGITNDPPETYLAWRIEVPLLSEANMDAEYLRDWFQSCRIEAHERLRDRTDRVKKSLQDLLKNHRKADPGWDVPVVVLKERGEAKLFQLSEITEKEFPLNYRTIVLPIEAGGLSPDGLMDTGLLDRAIDVAEENTNENRRERWLVVESAGEEEWQRLGSNEIQQTAPPSLDELPTVVLKAHAEGTEGESESRYLVLMASPRRVAVENPEIACTIQTLDQHSNCIEAYSNKIGAALKLDIDLQKALSIAARWHDSGKGRPVWQWYACNKDPIKLAKSAKYLHPRALGGYRHEFGSLLDALRDEPLKNETERDLILHLIAVHHGWARPHFRSNAWDHSCTTGSKQAAQHRAY